MAQLTDTWVQGDGGMLPAQDQSLRPTLAITCTVTTLRFIRVVARNRTEEGIFTAKLRKPHIQVIVHILTTNLGNLKWLCPNRTWLRLILLSHFHCPVFEALFVNNSLFKWKFFPTITQHKVCYTEPHKRRHLLFCQQKETYNFICRKGWDEIPSQPLLQHHHQQ